MSKQQEGSLSESGPQKSKFKDLQRRFEAARNIGRDAEGSYEGATDAVLRMVRFLESEFENIKKSGLNTEIERMRDAIRRADYDTAISLAESYYQSHYLPSHNDAPKTLSEMAIEPEVRK